MARSLGLEPEEEAQAERVSAVIKANPNLIFIINLIVRPKSVAIFCWRRVLSCTCPANCPQRHRYRRRGFADSNDKAGLLQNIAEDTDIFIGRTFVAGILGKD